MIKKRTFLRLSAYKAHYYAPLKMRVFGENREPREPVNAWVQRARSIVPATAAMRCQSVVFSYSQKEWDVIYPETYEYSQYRKADVVGVRGGTRLGFWKDMALNVVELGNFNKFPQEMGRGKGNPAGWIARWCPTGQIPLNGLVVVRIKKKRRAKIQERKLSMGKEEEKKYVFELSPIFFLQQMRRDLLKQDRIDHASSPAGRASFHPASPSAHFTTFREKSSGKRRRRLSDGT
ncbi:hypothetical protein Tco_1031194 [Tanacetum coccineum]|uniref:Uncharacterized protein n=1 Tax=Tanacetum coccineum TaxID=301880 RepID=A0ABQ5G8A4_9ASTR